MLVGKGLKGLAVPGTPTAGRNDVYDCTWRSLLVPDLT